MKTCKLLAIAALFLGLVACGEKDKTPLGKNYVQLSVDGGTGGSSSLAEDDTTPIKVDILLAHTPEEDITINFDLQGNDNEVLRLEGNPVMIKAGTKTAAIQVISNNKGLLKKEQTITLVAASFSKQGLQLQKNWVFTVTPAGETSDLSEEQKQLIEGYKSKFGIDLYRMIGKLECQVRVKMPEDDAPFNNGGVEDRVFAGLTQITLSSEATADKPILVMTDNPLGLNDFLYEMLRKETTEDVNEAWYSQPYPKAVMKLMGYTPNDTGIFDIKGKETFTTKLDHLTLSGGKIDFVGDKFTTTTDEETIIKAVPFEYNFSLWEKIRALDPHTKVVVEEGETSAEHDLSELLIAGGSLAPQDYLFISPIDKDEWEDDTFVTPSATYDFEKGEFSFTFSFDHTNSTGYSRIYVTYKMLPKK